MPAFVIRRAPGGPSLAPRLVRDLAEAMLARLELEHAELSVLLTDDSTIQELNRKHRQKDRPTDVLAFPLDQPAGDQPYLLGDVVISLATAQRQADSRKRPLLAELRFLLAHGLLHLIGYDHDTKEHKRAMDSMARRLVRSAPFPSAPVPLSRRKQPVAAASKPAPPRLARPKPVSSRTTRHKQTP